MGCAESKTVTATMEAQNMAKKPVKGVGQTERMVSRASRLQQQVNNNYNMAGSASNNTATTARTNRSSSGVGSTTGSMVGNSTAPANGNALPKLDALGNLMPEEVVRRTNSSITTETLILGTTEHPVMIEYAFWTQRGYYPDDPFKENQDELSINKAFAGAKNDALFGVYDGHGTEGHACARFAKKQLPQRIDKYLRQARVKKYRALLKAEGRLQGTKVFDPEKWPLLSPDEYKAACRKAFLECNTAMHQSEKVDAKMNGTTAITASLHGNLLAVCNVGDSRAVLGHAIRRDAQGNDSINTNPTSEEEKCEIGDDDEDDNDHDQQPPSAETLKNMGPKVFPRDGKLLAIPLSRDQTPYRKDERERVKKSGAAIMSIDQMEGIEEMHDNWGDMVLGEDVDIHGDPPRIWKEGKDFPGTAFTRSLGDYIAEGIGVTAEPEMIARELTQNDHLLVIASDGIFEFLTNQEVVDTCAACETPIVACQKLVKAAYDQWLIHERRTDDITVVVCFLSCSREPAKNGSTEGTTEDLVALAKSMYGNKPIRKKPRGGDSDALSSISSYARAQAAKTVAASTRASTHHPRIRGEEDEPVDPTRPKNGSSSHCSNPAFDNSESEGVIVDC